MGTAQSRQSSDGLVVFMAILIVVFGGLMALKSAAGNIDLSASEGYISVTDEFRSKITPRPPASNVAQSVTSNTGHADARHVSAPQVRTMVHNKAGECSELYFSPVRGTVLVLCHIEGDVYGGAIFRVTENMGARWLGDEGYECSVFVAQRSYWDRVILRDGYGAIGGIYGQFAAWIGW